MGHLRLLLINLFLYPELGKLKMLICFKIFDFVICCRSREYKFIIMDNLKSLQQALSIDVKLQELIILTSQLLNDLITQQGVSCVSIFNSNNPPNICLADFIHRIHKYTQFSKECLVIAIIYIDKYNMINDDFSLNNLNVHKILLTSLLLAAKFQDDFYYDNKTFEFAGGVNISQLHKFQMEIFEKLEFNLFVDEQQYNELEQKLYDVYDQEEES